MQDTFVHAGRKRHSFENKEPKIKVIGIGAAGTNIVGWLYNQNIAAELISINTDWTQLSAQPADEKLIIGIEEAGGKGCGGDMIKGRNAAKESLNDIKQFLDGELIFMIGGLGNGTSTGGLPVVAEEARKRGATVVAFVIAPFFMKHSDIEKTETALYAIDKAADTTIVLDHNKLKEVLNNLPLTESFLAMNKLVADSINSVISLIRERELMDVNFEHIRSVFKEGGFGTIGISESQANGPINSMIDNALGNRLFHFEPKNAEGAIVCIAGNSKMSLDQINSIASSLKNYTTEDANILVSPKIDESLGDKFKTAVILTGMKKEDLRVEEQIKDILGSNFNV